MHKTKKGPNVDCVFSITCCKDCTNRHENCHSECESYKKEKQERKGKCDWLKKHNENTMGYRAYDKHISNLIDNPGKRR